MGIHCTWALVHALLLLRVWLLCIHCPARGSKPGGLCPGWSLHTYIAHCIYNVYTMKLLCICNVRTLCILWKNIVYTLHIHSGHCIHMVHRLYIPCIDIAYTLCMHCMHDAYAMYIHCAYIVYTLYIQCIYNAHTMYIHCICTHPGCIYHLGSQFYIYVSISSHHTPHTIQWEGSWFSGTRRWVPKRTGLGLSFVMLC